MNHYCGKTRSLDCGYPPEVIGARTRLSSRIPADEAQMLREVAERQLSGAELSERLRQIELRACLVCSCEEAGCGRPITKAEALQLHRPVIGARTSLLMTRLLKEEAKALKSAAEAELVGEELEARLREIDSRTCVD